MSWALRVVVVGTSLLVGAGIGSYVTRLVYRPETSMAPSKSALSCPAPEPCPPHPTGTVEREPPGDVDLAVASLDVNRDEIPTSSTTGLLGLPPSALRLATTAFFREIEPCITAAKADGIVGVVLFDLTVTATSGLGHIREARSVKREGRTEEVETCLHLAALGVEFVWTREDGESKIRVPVRLNGATTAPDP